MTTPTKKHGGARAGAGRPPKVRQAAAAPGSTSAEEYLARVVSGAEAPDPVRVRAATALIRYQQAQQRAPIQSPPPQQLASQTKRAAETAIADEFARRAAEIRARHRKT